MNAYNRYKKRQPHFVSYICLRMYESSLNSMKMLLINNLIGSFPSFVMSINWFVSIFFLCTHTLSSTLFQLIHIAFSFYFALICSRSEYLMISCSAWVYSFNYWICYKCEWTKVTFNSEFDFPIYIKVSHFKWYTQTDTHTDTHTLIILIHVFVFFPQIVILNHHVTNQWTQ